MAWTGKVLGGLFGGLVGGPVGVAAGAALGHWFADAGEAARPDGVALELVRLDWQHHVFRPVGPGLLLTPVWTARGRAGDDVEVAVRVRGTTWRATVTVDEDPETCALPEVFVPYTHLAEVDGDAFIVEVRLRCGEETDRARYRVGLPSVVRRAGSSGPARVVMALVGAARAGDRPLGRDAVHFIRTRFEEAYPLTDEGRGWLRGWLRTLRDAEVGRLAPAKVAERLGRHVAGEAAEQVVEWVLIGNTAAWPGPAADAWAAAFAAGLGVDGAAVAARVEASSFALTPAGAAALLGVAPGATPEEIRGAWLRLVHAAHPDRHPGGVEAATRRTARLNQAYAALRDGVARPPGGG